MSKEIGGYQEVESIFTERIITNGWYEKSNLGWEKEYWTKTFEKKLFISLKKSNLKKSLRREPGMIEDRRKSNKNVEKDRRKEIQIEKNKVNSKKKK